MLDNKSLSYNFNRVNYLNIEKKLSILPIILTITGTIGNLLAFYVLTRKKLRVYSTMLYFASLTIMDTISLYQCNLEEESLFLCRSISFMAYFSLQTSAWILAMICVDRYLILVHNEWKRKISKNMKHTVSIILTITFVVALLNMPVIFLNGEVIVRKFNATNKSNSYIETEIDCYTTSYIKFWEKVIFFTECILPLSIMIIFNSLLIYKTHESSVKFRLMQQRRNTADKLMRRNKFSLQNIKNILTIINTTPAITQSKYEMDRISNSTLNLDSIHNNNNNRICVNRNRSNSIANRIKFHSSPNLCLDMNNNAIKAQHGDLLALPSTAKQQSFLAPPKSKFDTTSTGYSLISVDTSYDAQRVSMDTLNRDHDHVDHDESIQKLKNVEIIVDDGLTNEPKLNDKEYLMIKIEKLTKKPLFNIQNSKPNRRNNNHNNSRLAQVRNRKIILMLILLTTSFALSTLPSSLFFSFFRPILRGKPYRRLLSLMSTLLRHLSHTFNFIIYFKYSSMIKQELNQILNIKNIKTQFKKAACLLCVTSTPKSSFKTNQNANKTKTSSNINNVIAYTDNHNNNNNNNSNKIVKTKVNSSSSLDPFKTNSNCQDSLNDGHTFANSKLSHVDYDVVKIKSNKSSKRKSIIK